MSLRVAILAAVLVCVARPSLAQAPPLRLEIANGRVTLHAQNVPVRVILAEWARLGGVKIINGEGVAGAPVTLDLESVPERQALETVLRGVSGYVLAARQADQPGVSVYDRVMILPTSVAPRTPTPPVVAGGGVIRPIAPRPLEDPNAADEQDTTQNNDGVPLGRPVPLPRPVPIAGPGGIVTPPVVAPENEPAQQPPTMVVTPANPFGLPAGSSSRPGVIAPPQPQAPQQAPPRPGP